MEILISLLKAALYARGEIGTSIVDGDNARYARLGHV